MAVYAGWGVLAKKTSEKEFNSEHRPMSDYPDVVNQKRLHEELKAFITKISMDVRNVVPENATIEGLDNSIKRFVGGEPAKRELRLKSYLPGITGKDGTFLFRDGIKEMISSEGFLGSHNKQKKMIFSPITKSRLTHNGFEVTFKDKGIKKGVWEKLSLLNEDQLFVIKEEVEIKSHTKKKATQKNFNKITIEWKNEKKETQIEALLRLRVLSLLLKEDVYNQLKNFKKDWEILSSLRSDHKYHRFSVQASTLKENIYGKWGDDSLFLPNTDISLNTILNLSTSQILRFMQPPFTAHIKIGDQRVSVENVHLEHWNFLQEYFNINVNGVPVDSDYEWRLQFDAKEIPTIECTFKNVSGVHSDILLAKFA